MNYRFFLQDIPCALSTWSAKISVKKTDDVTVFCTGDTLPEYRTDDCWNHFYFYTKLKLPMSTFALAIGKWKVNTVNYGVVNARFIGPSKLVDEHFEDIDKYIPASFSAAIELFGPYPLKRCDFVVIHRSFSGLGLASPNLVFLSPR